MGTRNLAVEQISAKLQDIKVHAFFLINATIIIIKNTKNNARMIQDDNLNSDLSQTISVYFNTYHLSIK